MRLSQMPDPLSYTREITKTQPRDTSANKTRVTIVDTRVLTTKDSRKDVHNVEDIKSDPLEKLLTKVEELEGKLNWQRDKMTRLSTTLDRVMDRLSRMEAAQRANQEEEKKAAQPNAGKASRTPDQLLDALNYYSGIAEIMGQILQVLAGAVLLATAAIRKGKKPFPAGRDAEGEELDLTQLLQTANRLVHGLSGSGATDTVHSQE